MNDESMIKIMQSLDLNYQPAINSTLRFEKSIKSLNKQLAEMKTMAMRGAKDINSAFSSQLGSMVGNKQIVDQYGSPLKSLETEAVKSTASLKGVANAHTAASATAQSHAKSVKDVGAEYNILTSEFQRRASWFLTGTVFYGTISAAKEAITTIKDVEMGMVEVARVMNDSSFVFDDYRDRLLQIGVDYGHTFETVQGVALRWAQSGYNVVDSLKLTETAMLALNTAELDVKNSTESMIGIMAQWELQAEDMALVMDKINITADNYSVTSQDLVDGLLRSSGAAKVMGMSIDDTIGTLTVLREATGRTGREVGNALNSILSYIQRPSSLNILESMGIKVFANEAKTEFRDVMEVFDELATRWKDPSIGEGVKESFMSGAESAGLLTEEMAATMDMYDEYTDMMDAASEAQGHFTDVQKRDAAQAAAGARRRNYFIGLLERFNKVQEVTTNLVDAEGYSLKENADAMDTLEKKTQSLKTSMEMLAVAMGDAGMSDGLQALASGATDALNVINNMPKGLKDVVMGFTNVFLTIKTVEMGMKVFGIRAPSALQAVTNGLDGVKIATMSLAGGLKSAAASTTAFIAANAPLLILSATVGVIIALTNAYKKQREEQEKAMQIYKDYEATHSKIGGYAEEYKALAEQTSRTTAEEEKLVAIKQQIIDLLPESKSALDNENMSLATQLEIVKDLNEAELERARSAARKTLEKHEENYDYYKQQADEAATKLAEWTAVYEELYSRRDALTKKEQTDMRNARLMIDAQSERLKVNKANYEEVDAARRIYNESIGEATDLIDENVDSLDNLANSEKLAKEKMDELTDAFGESISKHSAYKSILDEVNSKEGLSAKSKQEIIEKHKELAPYLIDEDGLRKKLIEGMKAQEKTHSEVYKTMMNNDETYFTTLVGKNQWLRDQLAKLGKDQLADVKTLAQAKLAIESHLIKTLSAAWAKYYKAISTGNSRVADIMELRAEKDYRAGRDTELVRAVADASSVYTSIKALEDLAGGIGFVGGGGDYKSPPSGGSGSSKSASYENKELEESLKLLEHKKRITVETYETIKAEITELKRINSAYVKTEEERMTMAEKIFAAEKRYLDARLQNSVNWISDKKALDQLSVEEEIAAWERVKNNQIDNIEAVKLATLNLYKLKNEVLADSSSKEKNTIEHLKRLGILSVEEQIKAYRKLYEVKATSLEEERARVENLFSLYKELLSEQQGAIKDAYDKRIDMINAEAKKDKEHREAKIKAIQEELGLLDRADSDRSHEQTMAKLQEDLQYWSVRTSEEARKKVIEIQKQMEEEKYRYNLEQQKQALNDKIDVLRDEISEVDDAATKEKEKWENSYKLTEKAFDTHGSNIIALARTMSQDAYAEWETNYLIPLQNALASGDFAAFEKASGNLEGSISGLRDTTSMSNNSQIHRLASQILDYKRQYELGGDKSAGDRAKSVYDELQKLNPTVANMLHSMGYVSAKDYVAGLPKMHKGGKSLSYGAVEMMPGELTFPPDLSVKLENLIRVLYRNPMGGSSSSLTDNRKEVKIDKLVNIERNYMEDEVDSDMFARELGRLVSRAF